MCALCDSRGCAGYALLMLPLVAGCCISLLWLCRLVTLVVPSTGCIQLFALDYSHDYVVDVELPSTDCLQYTSYLDDSQVVVKTTCVMSAQLLSAACCSVTKGKANDAS
jgi:hypothetical protein